MSEVKFALQQRIIGSMDMKTLISAVSAISAILESPAIYDFQGPGYVGWFGGAIYLDSEVLVIGPDIPWLTTVKEFALEGVASRFNICFFNDNDHTDDDMVDSDFNDDQSTYDATWFEHCVGLVNVVREKPQSSLLCFEEIISTISKISVTLNSNVTAASADGIEWLNGAVYICDRDGSQSKLLVRHDANLSNSQKQELEVIAKSSSLDYILSATVDQHSVDSVKHLRNSESFSDGDVDEHDDSAYDFDNDKILGQGR